MNDPELDRLIREKMHQYLPPRPVQILHGGVIVLVSIAVGILALPAGEDAQQGYEAWLGVMLAVAGLALYVAWSRLRSNKARKEAHAEYLASRKQGA
jgi:protein-S-isoprenylcysteine O-methyltransferase Ste14